jgi:Tol biopolymer transport system component
MHPFALALAALVTPLAGVDAPAPRPEARIVLAAMLDTTPETGPQCNNRGDTEIFTVAPDGSDLRQLTDNRMHESTPAWSPDHSRIVFARRPPMHRDPGYDTDLFVMRPGGTHARRLTGGGPNDRDPAWSPNGGRIAFLRQYPEAPGRVGSADRLAMMVVRTDGSGLERLGKPQRNVGDPTPTWSPDGAEIAYTRGREPVSKILAGPPGGETRTLLQDGKRELSRADWSPRGGWIAYTSFRMNERIERVRTDGSRREVLSPQDSFGAHSPAWSPRGNRIAYAGRADGCLTHVFRMTADGNKHRDLLKGLDLEVYSLDW